ncbi:MAG: hypothetical protein AAF466_10670, partial [Bacteroidota bacterium]
MKTITRSRGAVPIIIVFLSLITLSCKTGRNIQKLVPEKLISLEQARELIQNYNVHRALIIKQYEDSVRNPGDDFVPAKFGAYTRDELKDYFRYIEVLAKLANIDSLGYQFYFTTYPESNTYRTNETVKYPRKNGFCIVPTMSKNGMEFGFQVLRTANGKFEPLLIKDVVAA